MTDNLAGSVHENGDHGAQENPEEIISPVSQTEIQPVDEDTSKDDLPDEEFSIESSDFAEPDQNEDIQEDTAEFPDQPKSFTRGEPRQDQPRKSVVVRYGLMRQIGEFHHNLQKYLPKGVKVVVRTERGVELGEVIINVKNDDSQQDETSNVCTGCCSGLCVEGDKLDEFIKNCGSNYPFRHNGRVLRIANQQDIIDYRHLAGSACEEAKYARDQIKQRNLPMKLVSVEHLLGGGRIVFHFTAETRVDFRELVRDLASQFRTRIEMRQVGARDEARLVADYERCGQRCCCQEFLKDLKPVSMRMAKVQKATLDPSKISGRCSRLMCCLRYEDASYEELRKKLPRRNTWVRTDEVTGKIIDTQIITQLVRLLLPDGTHSVVAVEDIVERDVEPVTEQTLQESYKSSQKNPAEYSPTPQYQSTEISSDNESEEEEESGKKESRRSRRRRKTDFDDETVPDEPVTDEVPKEDHEQIRAKLIENAPELPPLQDDAVTPVPLPTELVDAEDDSIPLSELFGIEAPVESQQVDLQIKPEFRFDEQIEPQAGSAPQDNREESRDKDNEKDSASGNAPKKKKRRRRRGRRKK